MYYRGNKWMGIRKAEGKSDVIKELSKGLTTMGNPEEENLKWWENELKKAKAIGNHDDVVFCEDRLK